MVSFRNRPLEAPAALTVVRTGRARIPTRYGEFTAFSYRDEHGLEHIAKTFGDPASLDSPLVRVHSECLTGDVFGSLRCDCGSQLERATELIAASTGGAVVYVRGHEGRGISLGHKLQAYELQDEGLDTVDANHALGFPADLRDYSVAAAILRDLGVSQLRLLSNNGAKSDGLSEHGIEITELIPLHGVTTPENARYLQTKRDRMNHLA